MQVSCTLLNPQIGTMRVVLARVRSYMRQLLRVILTFLEDMHRRCGRIITARTPGMCTVYSYYMFVVANEWVHQATPVILLMCTLLRRKWGRTVQSRAHPRSCMDWASRRPCSGGQQMSSREVGACASPSRAHCTSSPLFCCWTSPPTTWTSELSSGWRWVLFFCWT